MPYLQDVRPGTTLFLVTDGGFDLRIASKGPPQSRGASDVNHASRPRLETPGCDSNQNRGIWAIDRSAEQFLFFVVGHCK